MNTENGPIEELMVRSVQAGKAWVRMTPERRGEVLEAVANALDAAVDRLVPIAQDETHLPQARLRGELSRTTFQLRLLAKAAVTGSHLDVRIDHADPTWPMGVPRPDLRRTSVPLGPILVFGASNFPFAFSVAGGDTAAALAAGCAVVYKAHGGHPRLSDATSDTVLEALRDAEAPDGLFSLIHSPEDARAVLVHPDLKAAAFTGSIPAGRALFDLAQARPEPIPFFGELGSINPVFVTERAAAAQAQAIADGFIGSFTLGGGQFCTKPGLLMVPADSELMSLLARADLPSGTTLLNDRITDGHAQVLEQLSGRRGVTVLSSGSDGPVGTTTPILLLAAVDAFLADFDEIFTECFGPTSLVVAYGAAEDLLRVAAKLDGQLTATVFAEADDAVVPRLLEVLASKAGRLLWNDWPTGVSVTHAQQHGGPYPASTAPSSTSIGTVAIKRFVRPVAWQGFPEHLLPDELRESTNRRIVRLVDGDVTSE